MSEPGEGSTFTVTLPIAGPASAPRHTPETGRATPRPTPCQADDIGLSLGPLRRRFHAQPVITAGWLQGSGSAAPKTFSDAASAMVGTHPRAASLGNAEDTRTDQGNKVCCEAIRPRGYEFVECWDKPPGYGTPQH